MSRDASTFANARSVRHSAAAARRRVARIPRKPRQLSAVGEAFHHARRCRWCPPQDRSCTDRSRSPPALWPISERTDFSVLPLCAGGMTAVSSQTPRVLPPSRKAVSFRYFARGSRGTTGIHRREIHPVSFVAAPHHPLFGRARCEMISDHAVGIRRGFDMFDQTTQTLDGVATPLFRGPSLVRTCRPNG